MKKRLVLIDGHSVLYRAFHAYPMLTTSDGELINAVYGFTSIVLNVISALEPTHLAVAFDKDKPTFRHTEFTGYKAQREEMPTELSDQLGRVGEVVEALNFPEFSVEGYEADDVIGTLAAEAKKEAVLDEVVIVTSDQDALQLVESDGKVKIRVYIPGRGAKPAMMFDEGDVEKKYEGLEPEQVPDLKGLAGDSSDNIPGVKGIGPKTAIKLLKEFETVEGVYENIEKVGNLCSPRILKLLSEDQEQALMSKRLATIVRDAPIDLKIKKCELHEYDKAETIKLFQKLEFKTLIKKLPEDKFEKMVQGVLL